MEDGEHGHGFPADWAPEDEEEFEEGEDEFEGDEDESDEGLEEEGGSDDESEEEDQIGMVR